MDNQQAAAMWTYWLSWIQKSIVSMGKVLYERQQLCVTWVCSCYVGHLKESPYKLTAG
jgi:hypothetical protein